MSRGGDSRRGPADGRYRTSGSGVSPSARSVSSEAFNPTACSYEPCWPTSRIRCGEPASEKPVLALHEIGANCSAVVVLAGGGKKSIATSLVINDVSGLASEVVLA